ncbi:MAG: cation:proton antiporter [Myxococcales bacterium]|nr:cation:proton antiporter [Myxococcales bacterium]
MRKNLKNLSSAIRDVFPPGASGSWGLALVLLVSFAAAPIVFASGGATGGHEEGNSLTHLMAKLMLQLSVIMFAAKIGGELCERYLKQPGVLGELVIGMVIGPFALGGMIPTPGMHEALFHASGEGPVPVSVELYAIAQLAAVLLLFMAGLETDLKKFLRYAGPATFIALGGVILPFFLGVWGTILAGHTDNWLNPEALFVGAIMTATSVGITARVLSDIGKIETTEGVVILAGAVVDDVLGIIILAIVVNIAAAGGGEVDGAKIGLIAAKAVGFWLLITGAAVLLAKRIEKIITWFRSAGATMVLAVGLCLFAAAIAELAGGLAMIIGAYSMGLGLSSTEVKHYLEEKIESAYQLLVPVFFVVMGMLVDFRAMEGAIAFGALISFFAIISKVVGCGLPALLVNFNRVGALRIGIGMLPRGEVALIVAGVGLSAGVVGQDVFGVAIMMTMVTTLIAPVILVPIFQRGGDGRRSIPAGESGGAAVREA